jgi:branched-chain amino acid transport system substrate-binding protein
VGEEFKGAVQMAFEEIDYKIGDYTVELVWIDSQGDPEKATRAYEEAVLRDEIDAGTLQWQSSVAMAVMELAANNKVPHFFGFGATEGVNEKYESDPERYSYWMGKTWPSPVKLSAAYVETLEAAISQGTWSPPAKTVAIFGEDTDWGRSFGAGIKGQLEAAGWTTVSEDYFARGETEFYPLLNRLKDQEVALLAGTANSPSTESFVKQAREVGLNSLIVMDGMGWVGTWYELCGDACDYVLDQIPQWTTDEAKAFRDQFTEKYGFEPSPSAAGLSYDMIRFLIKVANRTLEKEGELSREALYKVGQEELWTGQLTFTRDDGAIIMEEYKYDASSVPDPIVGQGKFIFPVIQYFSGQGQVIWPDVWKTTDLAIPESMQ